MEQEEEEPQELVDVLLGLDGTSNAADDERDEKYLEKHEEQMERQSLNEASADEGQGD